MPYRELPPPPELAPLVACLWTRDPAGAPYRQRVLPDACVDVVWVGGAHLMVAGPATGPVTVEVLAGARVAGVRFRVGAAGAALGVPAVELADRGVALADVWGADAHRLEERLAEAPFPLGDLARGVAARLPERFDPLVRAAALGLARPDARVPELGTRLGIGERQLRRRFGEAVGYGPKTLQRILRFQGFLRLAEREPGTDLARLALDAGYADQAHLTREARRLGGLPPSALLAAGAAPAGERSDSFKTAPAAPAKIAA
jgi:AraC-like DNA-binding protein